MRLSSPRSPDTDDVRRRRTPWCDVDAAPLAGRARSRMSPVPASARRPPPLFESVVHLVDAQPLRSSHTTRPGSTLPLRVAMTNPSSGVNPMVVSTGCAAVDGAQRRAGAEVAGHGRELGERTVEDRPAPCGPLVRQAMEPVAAHPTAPATTRGWRRSTPQVGALRGTRCRSTRRPVHREPLAPPRRCRPGPGAGAAARAA